MNEWVVSLSIYIHRDDVEAKIQAKQKESNELGDKVRRRRKRRKGMNFGGGGSSSRRRRKRRIRRRRGEEMRACLMEMETLVSLSDGDGNPC